MKPDLLILRPQPGAAASAERARHIGLVPAVAPLFEVKPLAWEAPDAGRFDAVMLTSANAARYGGAGLTSLRHLPCFVVGEATAAAAGEAGFGDTRTGAGDGAALLDLMAGAGVRRVLHLSGRDRIALHRPEIEITTCEVYASEAVAVLPRAALVAVGQGALALVHSPRAGSVFATLVDAAGAARPDVSVAAISEAAAAALGSGWKDVAVAPQPRDEALLELAKKLCNKGGGGGAVSGE